MLGHMLQHAVLVLQEADMAQLVHLVIADDHDREAPADISQRFFTACQGRNTSAGEGDLAGRGEHENAVLGAILLAFIQQHRGLDDFIGQVVNNVSFVPENLEIRGSGLHGCKAADGFIAVDIAIGVGVLRYAPDALDGVVFGNQLFHHIHIGAVRRHGDRDQLKAKLLGDFEMAVIAGGRAEELAVLHLGPRAGGFREAKGMTYADKVVHQLQAGVAAHKNLAGLNAHHIAKQGAGFFQTFQVAIIAGIIAILGGIVTHFQQIHGQVHLMRAWFTAGHVELKALGLELGIGLFQRSLFCTELFFGHFKIICHNHFPLDRGLPWCCTRTGQVQVRFPLVSACMHRAYSFQTYILV